MSIFVPVSSKTCGIYCPLEACNLEDEGSVEEKRGGGGGGTEMLRWLIAPLEKMVAVGEFNSLMILVFCLKSSTQPV